MQKKFETKDVSKEAVFSLKDDFKGMIKNKELAMKQY